MDVNICIYLILSPLKNIMNDRARGPVARGLCTLHS